DDRILERDARVDDANAFGHRLVHQASPAKVAACPPWTPAGNRPGIGIQQDVPGIKPMPVVLGSIDAITVTKLLRQPVHADMPVIAGSIVQVIELDLGQDLALAWLGENEPDRSA